MRISDWSSDVCSSDLRHDHVRLRQRAHGGSRSLPEPAGIPGRKLSCRSGGDPMRALSAAIICALVPVTAAHAVEVPRGGPSDPRVKFVEYEETEVYRIVGTFRTATQIVLIDDETIQHGALGATVAWEVAVAGLLLFLKPRGQ